MAKVEKKVEKVEETLDSAVDALELDDLEVMSPRMVLSNEASGGRTGQAIIWESLFFSTCSRLASFFHVKIWVVGEKPAIVSWNIKNCCDDFLYCNFLVSDFGQPKLKQE